MNLYYLYQTDNTDYDTYDACIVAAESEEEAKLITPSDFNSIYGEWACNVKGVNVRLIGMAIEGTEAGLILASYNAG